MKKTTILFLFICSFFNAQFYETIKYPEYFSSTLARMTNNNTIDKINNSCTYEEQKENIKISEFYSRGFFEKIYPYNNYLTVQPIFTSGIPIDSV